ncbi:MAG TPA: ferritin family protein [Chitinivibrionales bacterium]|jgi:rubrerythrin|nr:ferritin family protein [Chitinivibrionales bacterium]
MDPLDLALNIETEGKAYYETLAAESPVKALSGVFSVLAAEEQQHFDLFDEWRKKRKAPAPPQPGTASAKAKQIFADLSVQFIVPQAVYDYAQAYAKALELETKSISMYADMLSKANAPGDKKALQFLITEEQKHEHLVEHLLEFVNEPKEFLENAEFNHLG